jgi:hypothetical protein
MYYFWANDKQAGPYTLNQVRAMWNSGQVNATTLYWQNGMTTWGHLSQIIHLIEQPNPAPRSIPTKTYAPSEPSREGINSILRPLLAGIFCLSIASFFLPNISIAVPIVGTHGFSMFDLVMRISDPSWNEDATQTAAPAPVGDSTQDSSAIAPQSLTNTSPDSTQHTSLLQTLDDRFPTDPEGQTGTVICAVSILLLIGHYFLTLLWGIIAITFRRIFNFLTFIWLCFAVQFPVLFLIGAHMLMNSLVKQEGNDLAGNPFAARTGNGCKH